MKWFDLVKLGVGTKYGQISSIYALSFPGIFRVSDKINRALNSSSVIVIVNSAKSPNQRNLTQNVVKCKRKTQ